MTFNELYNALHKSIKMCPALGDENILVAVSFWCDDEIEIREIKLTTESYPDLEIEITPKEDK